MAICLYHLIVQSQVTTVDTCTSYILNHGTIVILFNRIDWIYSVLMYHFMYISCTSDASPLSLTIRQPPRFCGFGFVMSQES